MNRVLENWRQEDNRARYQLRNGMIVGFGMGAAFGMALFLVIDMLMRVHGP